MALTAGGKRAVSSGSYDNTLRVWDLEGNQPPRVLKGHTGQVNSVALTADGKRAVSGSWGGTLRVWDLEGNQPPRVLKGHTDMVYAVALTADGKRAVSGSHDKTLRVWDLEGNQPPRVLEGPRVVSVPWRWRPMASAPSPALTTTRCGFGIWRATNLRASWKATFTGSMPWR